MAFEIAMSNETLPVHELTFGTLRFFSLPRLCASVGDFGSNVSRCCDDSLHLFGEGAQAKGTYEDDGRQGI